MRQLLLYTLLRLAAFAACFGLFTLLFGRAVPLLLVALLALVVTSIVFLIFLRPQGAAAGETLGRAVRRLWDRSGAVLVGRPTSALRRRYEESRSKEDAD